MYVSVGAPSIMPRLFAEQPGTLPSLPDKHISSDRARWQGLAMQKHISRSVLQQRIGGAVVFWGSHGGSDSSMRSLPCLTVEQEFGGPRTYNPQLLSTAPALTPQRLMLGLWNLPGWRGDRRGQPPLPHGAARGQQPGVSGNPRSRALAIFLTNCGF